MFVVLLISNETQFTHIIILYIFKRASCQMYPASVWLTGCIQGHFRIQFHIQETLKRVTLPTFIIPSHAVQILMWSFELSLCCVYYCHFQHQDTWTNPGAEVTCELRGFCYISVQSTWARTGCNGKTVAINECKYKVIFFFAICSEDLSVMGIHILKKITN